MCERLYFNESKPCKKITLNDGYEIVDDTTEYCYIGSVTIVK